MCTAGRLHGSVRPQAVEAAYPPSRRRPGSAADPARRPARTHHQQQMRRPTACAPCGWAATTPTARPPAARHRHRSRRPGPASTTLRRRPPSAIRHAEIRRLAPALREARHALKSNRAQLHAIVDERRPRPDRSARHRPGQRRPRHRVLLPPRALPKRRRVRRPRRHQPSAGQQWPHQSALRAARPSRRWPGGTARVAGSVPPARTDVGSPATSWVTSIRVDLISTLARAAPTGSRGRDAR